MATTGQQQPRTATRIKEGGNTCLKGWCPCRGRVGGRGDESGITLSTNMEKRMVQLRLVLGPAPASGYPEELLRPAGKVSAGGLGNVRISKAHYEKENMGIGYQGGHVRQQAAGRALPTRALVDVTETVRAQQVAAGRAPTAGRARDDAAAGGAAPAARPARGERAAQTEAQRLAAAVDAAVASIPDEEARALVRKQLDAAAASKAAVAALENTVTLHQTAAKATSERLGELAVLRKKVKKIARELKRAKGDASARLFSYRRFKTDERLHKELDQWLFLPTIEVLDAYLAFLDACHPLDKIVWLDSNAREKPADGAAAAAADGAAPAPKRRKCGPPMAAKDAVVLWLFVLRTGTTFKRTAALFGVSRTTVRRAFVTMTSFHKEIFREEFFALEPSALRAIIPEMMKTFADYEGVETAVAHIIDGFEKAFQKPSDDEVASVCWSAYKHNYTAKYLLDILSNGAFYFISDGHPGSINDPNLVKVRGFLDLMIEGFDVMADKGFLIEAELEALGCLCWIPPVRRRGQDQCTAEESESTHVIANRRIYVENAVRRIKEFGWFGEGTLSIQHKHLHGDVAYCVAMLCNFARPLVPTYG